MKGLIFTYVVTYGGALAALFNPWIGVLGYIVFSIIRPELLWFWAVPQGNYTRVLAIATLFGWAANGFGDWRLGRATLPICSMVAFFLWSVASATIALDQEAAWACVDVVFKIILPVFVGITLIDSLQKLKTLIWTIVLSEGYLALQFNEQYLFNGFNMAEDGYAGFGRAVLAIGLVLTLAMAFFLALTAERRWHSALAMLCALLIGHAVFLTFSRGGILSLIVSGGVAFWLIPKRPLYFIIMLVVVAIALRMAGPEVRKRFFTTFASEEERDESAQSRIELWGNCLEIVAREPLTGIGPENFRTFAQKLFGWQKPKEAHNLWLQTAAEVGIPGLCFLVFFYASTVVRLWELARRNGRIAEPWLPAAAAMVASGIIGFAVGSCFVTVTLLDLPYFVALVGAGTLKLASDPHRVGFDSRLAFHV